MKKILLIISILVLWITVHAAEYQEGEYDQLNTSLLGDFNVVTYTSEPCLPTDGGSFQENKSQTQRYKCTISASSGFVDFISSIYKYVFFISLVIGVLMMVVLGIGISISWLPGVWEEVKTQAKQKIVAIFLGLVALALIPWILKTVAPFFFE